MAEEKVYSKINEADETIKALQEKYAEVFWAVRPEMITVMGVENKTRSKGSLAKTPYYAALRPMKGVQKAILQLNNVDTRYVIEVYWDEWRD